MPELHSIRFLTGDVLDTDNLEQGAGGVYTTIPSDESTDGKAQVFVPYAAIECVVTSQTAPAGEPDASAKQVSQ